MEYKYQVEDSVSSSVSNQSCDSCSVKHSINADDVQLLALINWMGPQLKSTYLVSHIFSGTGRGIKAVRDIGPGTRLISVGSSFCYTSRLACLLHPEIPPKLRRDPLICLTAFLLLEHELGASSRLAPYLNSLPRTFTNPLFTFGGVIPNLVCSEMTALFERQQGDFLTAMDVRCLGDFDFERILWAWFAVQTRTLYVTPTEPALVPFLDLFNHSPEARVITRWNTEEDVFEIITETAYKAGEQVFINYGAHDNKKLAVYYGFTVPRNPFSEVMISLDNVLQDLPVTPEQKEFLQSYNAWRPLALSWEGFSSTSKLFLRARLTSKRDLWKILDSEDIPNDSVTHTTMFCLLSAKIEEVAKYTSDYRDSPVLASVYEEDLNILEENMRMLRRTKNLICGPHSTED